MRIEELAEEFAGINLFNPYTQKRVINIAQLFVKRAGVELIESINLLSLARFKIETLRVAQPVTYNGYIKYLRMIGKYAVSKEYISENPFSWIQTAPIGVIPHKTIDQPNLTDIIRILDDPEYPNDGWFWSAVVQCLYFTGMRRRQLVNLKREHIDLNEKSITLSYQGSKTKREWDVPLHPTLEKVLSHLIRETEKIRGRRIKPGEYVFRIFDINKRYKPVQDNQGMHRMAPECITGFFKRFSNSHEIRVGSHRLRHTLATVLCNPGDETPPDLFAVQTLLGHQNIATTRGYVHTELSRLKRVIHGLKDIQDMQDCCGIEE